MKSEMLDLPVRESSKVIEILRNDPVITLIKKEFPSFFLVGGYIRDLFLGRIANDRDYVVSGKLDHERIKRLSDQLGGSFFIIKNLARIVFEDKEIDITFTDEPLERDLSKRDFTINSLAWSPETGIIDLYGGLEDIKKRIIRAISRENLRADPVRILRAYRLAAEIKGSIEPSTRKALSELRFLLRTSAKERITSEIIKLLNLEEPDRYIKMAIDDKILHVILDVSNKDINFNFKFYKKLTVFFRKYTKDLPLIPFSQGLSAIGFLRLLCLSYKKKNWLIKLSKRNQRLLEAFHNVIKKWRPELLRDREQLFLLFYELKDFPEGLGFLLSEKRLLREAQRFKEVIEKPLLTGLDIVKISDIKSRDIGVILKKLWALQFSGNIGTKEEALRELRRFKSG